MESTKTIKGIDDNTWSKFKSIAAENNLKMPEMFRTMVNEWDKSSDFWNKVLNTGKLLSNEEAESILRTSKRIRSESGYR